MKQAIRFSDERLHYFSFSLPLGCFATSLVATSLIAMTIQRDRGCWRPEPTVAE
jgi:hypothetical protein